MAFEFQGLETIARDSVLGDRHRAPDRSPPPDPRNTNRGRGFPPRGRARGGRPFNRPPSASRRPYTANESDEPKAWNVFDIILNEYNGKARYTEIQRLFPRSWNDKVIFDWLEKDQRFSPFVDNSGRLKFVSVHCRARLCVYYGQGHCNNQDCGNFHYCRNFLAGFCNMMRNCNQNHAFDDDHNLTLRRKLHLGKYDNPQMKRILRNSLPQVCSNYNGPGCNMEDGCSFLHVCKEFVMKECTDEDCMREHSFEDEHTLRLLTTFKLDRLANTNVNLLRKNILARRERDEMDHHQERNEVRKVHPRDSSDQIAETSKPKPYGRQVSNHGDKTNPKQREQKFSGRQNRRGRGSARSAWSARDSSLSHQDNRPRRDSDSPEMSLVTSETEEVWLGPSQRYSSGEGASSAPQAAESSARYRHDHDIDDGETLVKPLMGVHLGHQPILDGSRMKKKPDSPVLDRRGVGKERGRNNPKPRVRANRDSESGAGFPLYICEKHLSRRACDPDCDDFHCDQKYAWFAHMDGKWCRFDGKEEDKMENAYFNPVEGSWHIQINSTLARLDFDSMEAVCDSTGTSMKVRRLAPRSSKWQWYMSKKANHYSELTEKLSDLFEEHFVAQETSFQFTRSSGKTYLVNFMTNTLTICENRERDIPFTGPIRRRPKAC